MFPWFSQKLHLTNSITFLLNYLITGKINLGTTSRRCSGWVRLSISDTKQQNNENSKNKPTDPNNKENEGSKPTGSTNTGNFQGNTPNKNNDNHNGPQSIAIIDVPINCPEGFRPDPRGICRESF